MPKRMTGAEVGMPSSGRRAAEGRGQEPPIPVLVAAVRRTVAEALALALGRDRGLLVAIALSATEAVQSAARDGPGVVLLDLGMPGPGGVETIRHIREAAPGTSVIAMSALDDDLVWARAIEAGACGYLPRSTSLDDLPGMVRRAARGDRLISPDEGARLVRLLRRQRHQDSTERQRANRLTARQLEILQLTADGTSARDIADQLHMSPLTLRTHMQNILTRLGVHTKLDAVTVALRHGKLKTRL